MTDEYPEISREGPGCHSNPAAAGKIHGISITFEPDATGWHGEPAGDRSQRHPDPDHGRITGKSLNSHKAARVVIRRAIGQIGNSLDAIEEPGLPLQVFEGLVWYTAKAPWEAGHYREWFVTRPRPIYLVASRPGVAIT